MSQFSPIDCMATVYPIGEGWVGKSTAGQVRYFQSLDDYKTFLNNLASSGRVCPDVSVPVARPEATVVDTPHTGYLEFLPRNRLEQSKYSAMSPSWEGQASTQRALDQGKFSAEEVYRYRASDVKGGTQVAPLGATFRSK